MYSTSVAVLRIIDSQTYSGRVEIVHLLPLPLNSGKYLMTSAAEILRDGTQAINRASLAQGETLLCL